MDHPRLFKDHVEPIFIDLSSVHVDYVSGFEQVRALLWDNRVALWEIATKVDTLRSGLGHLRSKLTALASALKDESGIPDEVQAFAEAALNYFKLSAGNGSTLRPIHGATFYTTLLDLIELAEKQKLSRAECEKWGEALRDEVAEKWSDITVAYAKAKMKCLR